MLKTHSLRFCRRAASAIRSARSPLQFVSIALLSAAFLLTPDIAHAQCDDGDGSCDPNSCTALNSCESIDDCLTGSLCIPYWADEYIGCSPSGCGCYQGYWTCTDDCAPQCVAGLPDDIDRDGALDSNDNCVIAANYQQGDSDLDGYGNRCDGDFDQDGDTDQDDGDFFSLNCTGGTAPPICDLDESGTTGDLADLMIFASLYGEPPGPSGLACAGTVPCPAPPAVPALGRTGMAGLLLALIASAVAVRRRWMTA
jgi:hypothetical protein